MAPKSIFHQSQLTKKSALYPWQQQDESLSKTDYYCVLESRRNKMLESLFSDGALIGSAQDEDVVNEWMALVGERDKTLRAIISEANKLHLVRGLSHIFIQLREVLECSNECLPLSLRSSLLATSTEVRSFLHSNDVTVDNLPRPYNINSSEFVSPTPSTNCDSAPFFSPNFYTPSPLLAVTGCDGISIDNNVDYSKSFSLHNGGLKLSSKHRSTTPQVAHSDDGSGVGDITTIVEDSAESLDNDNDEFLSPAVSSCRQSLIDGIDLRAMVLNKPMMMMQQQQHLTAYDRMNSDDADLRSEKSYETSDSKFTTDSSRRRYYRNFPMASKCGMIKPTPVIFDAEVLREKIMKLNESEVD